MMKTFLRNFAQRLRCICVFQCCVTVQDSDDNLEVMVCERQSMHQHSEINSISSSTNSLPITPPTVIDDQKMFLNFQEDLNKQFILKFPEKFKKSEQTDRHQKGKS